MTRTLAAALLALLALTGRSVAEDGKLSVKVADTPPPKELAEPVRTLLDAKAMSVFDAKGKLLCTVWPRKTMESKAAADTITAGLKYSHLTETAIVGAVQFPVEWRDYRKQKVKPGVYTLRLGIQPMDGDHMGTAPYNEFCLLCPAEKDKKPDPMEAMELHDLSAASTVNGKHPGVMLLFPNKKPADAPTVDAKPNETWVVSYKLPVTAAGKKFELGFSLAVVGHTMAE